MAQNKNNTMDTSKNFKVPSKTELSRQQQKDEVNKIKVLQYTYGGSIHTMDYNEGSAHRCNGTWYYLVISASDWRNG